MQASKAFTELITLRDQARALAKQESPIAAHSASHRGIAFIVNGDRFFCDAHWVNEIAVLDELIAVPQSKAWLRGVFNSKGMFVSVVDLGLLAGVDKAIAEQRGHLIILKHASLQCALLVNRVIGFRAFDFDTSMVNKSGHASNDSQTDEWWDSLSEFVGDPVEENGVVWRYLDLDKLISSEVFLEVQ